MCFTPQWSISLFMISIGMLGYVSIFTNRDIFQIMPYILYSIMELTQFLQYMVIDDCSNKWNILLTNFVWILEWLQPLMWNVLWYTITTNNKNVFKFTIYFCSIVFILAMMRIFYSFGDFKKTHEIQSGNRTCTTNGIYHLQWENKLGHMKGFEPNWFSYIIMWFLPLLWLRPIKLGIIYFLGFTFGIILTFIINRGALNNEFASIWCLLSIPTLIFNLILLQNKYT
jgi:hypothetical protein